MTYGESCESGNWTLLLARTKHRSQLEIKKGIEFECCISTLAVSYVPHFENVYPAARKDGKRAWMSPAVHLPDTVGGAGRGSRDDTLRMRS